MNFFWSNEFSRTTISRIHSIAESRRTTHGRCVVVERHYINCTILIFFLDVCVSLIILQKKSLNCECMYSQLPLITTYSYFSLYFREIHTQVIMMKIDAILELLEQPSPPNWVAGPIVVKVVRDNYHEDKTVTIGDETGALILHLQLATNPLIRVGAILRLFNILVKSNHLHFTTTSLVDTAINIASKGVQDLTTEPEPWFTAEVVQIS